MLHSNGKEIRMDEKLEKKELNQEEQEMVDGGWSIFDPVKKVVNNAAKWTYDTTIKPAANATADAAKKVADAVNYVADQTIDALGVKKDN